MTIRAKSDDQLNEVKMTYFFFKLQKSLSGQGGGRFFGLFGMGLRQILVMDASNPPSY